MSLDINKVIMEATNSLLETTKPSDDKGDKAQTGADKNSYHVGDDKVPGEPTSATKEVTENKDIVTEGKKVGKVDYEPGPYGSANVGKGYSEHDSEMPKQHSYHDSDNPSAVSEIGRKASRVVGNTVHGAIDAVKQEPIATGTAAAIAAGLGAVALAKKLRKEKKKSTLVKAKA